MVRETAELVLTKGPTELCGKRSMAIHAASTVSLFYIETWNKMMPREEPDGRLLLHRPVPSSVPEGSPRHASGDRWWQNRRGRGAWLSRRNSRRGRKKDASGQRLSTGGVLCRKAGDEIRTHDIHVGNVTLYH